MTILNFPDPAESQVYSAAGKTWVWNGVNWAGATTGGSSGANVTISGEEPTGAEPGDLWWEPISQVLYIYYDSGSEPLWVPASGSGGTSDLPAPLTWEPSRTTPTLTISGSQTNLFRLGSTSETRVQVETVSLLNFFGEEHITESASRVDYATW
jgi:hypothetical protein